jgi:hypothetical protein
MKTFQRIRQLERIRRQEFKKIFCNSARVLKIETKLGLELPPQG